MPRTETSPVVRRFRAKALFPSSWLAFAAAAVLVLGSQSTQAQLVLMPGETRENIAATPVVLEKTAPTNSLVADVAFDGAAPTQNMRLFTNAAPALKRTAIARGRLSVDFCVPRAGLATCDAKADPMAPDVVASVTFRFGMVGVVSAVGPGATASFDSSAAVVDIDTGKNVNYQKLTSLSASNGQVKKVAGVPVLIPDFADATVNLPVTFTTLLKRGKKYRFQLWAQCSSTGVAGAPATCNFLDLSPQFPAQRGRVQLHELTISVGQVTGGQADELQALRDVVASLHDQVGGLGDQIDALVAELREDLTALSQAHADLARRTDVPGSLLMMPVGSPPPLGYTFVGTFDLAPTAGSRGRPAMKAVDVYRKNPG